MKIGEGCCESGKLKSMNPQPVSWFAFYASVIIPAVVLVVIATLTFYKLKSRPVPWAPLFAILALVVAVLGFAVKLLIAPNVPLQNVRLFGNPISSVQSIQVKPVQSRSLVDNPIAITNQSAIGDLMTAIRSAQPYTPSHPQPRWKCNLVISDQHGNSYVELLNLMAPTPQGTIVFCKTSERGFIYKTLKSDTIADILGKATGRNVNLFYNQ